MRGSTRTAAAAALAAASAAAGAACPEAPTLEGAPGAAQAQARMDCLYHRYAQRRATEMAIRAYRPAVEAHRRAKGRLDAEHAATIALLSTGGWISRGGLERWLAGPEGPLGQDRSRHLGGANDGDPRPEQRAQAAASMREIARAADQAANAAWWESIRQPPPVSGGGGGGPDQPAPPPPRPAPLQAEVVEEAMERARRRLAARGGRAPAIRNDTPALAKIIERAVDGRCPSLTRRADLPYPCGHGAHGGRAHEDPGAYDPVEPGPEALRAVRRARSTLLAGKERYGHNGEPPLKVVCALWGRGYAVNKSQEGGPCDWMQPLVSGSPLTWLKAKKAERKAACRTTGVDVEAAAHERPRCARPRARLLARARTGLEPQWRRYARREGATEVGAVISGLEDEMAAMADARTWREAVEAAITAADSPARRCIAEAARECAARPDRMLGEDADEAVPPVLHRRPWAAGPEAPPCVRRIARESASCAAVRRSSAPQEGG